MGFAHRVVAGKPFHLKDVDSSAHGGLSKDDCAKRTEQLGAEMQELLDLLYYAGETALLVVLQGRDTSGKDGLIRHFLNYSSVQSCRVVPFKEPTAEELAHDFLWRVHVQAPERGSIALFNRSHYEDVLVVRVHDLVPEAVWRKRYDQINHFESLLTAADTIVLKFYLHISDDEQKRRLLERERETEKAWKLSVQDWKERELWPQYAEAYEDALTRCSTDYAPWFVVPADHKWFRNLAVMERVVEALRPHREQWLGKLKKIGEVAKREIEEYRKGKNEG